MKGVRAAPSNDRILVVLNHDYSIHDYLDIEEAEALAAQITQAVAVAKPYRDELQKRQMAEHAKHKRGEWQQWCLMCLAEGQNSPEIPA